MEAFNLVHEFSLVCGIVITFIILLLLAKKQNGYLHQKLLLGFFIIILFLFFNHYAGYHKIYWLFVITTLFTNGIGFLIAPLIYLYVIALFKEVHFRKMSIWLIFVPYILFTLIISLPFSLSNPADGLIVKYLIFYFDNELIFYFIEILYLLFFAFFSLRIVNQFIPAIPAYYSNLAEADILWSKRLLLCIIGYITIDIALVLIEGVGGKSYIFDIYVNVFATLMVVLYLGYYGFFQSQILIPSFLIDKLSASKQPLEKVKNKPVKAMSYFSKKEVERIREAISLALEKEKLYLNKSLTLSDLAQEIQLTDKKLSTFINQDLSTNFYELINRYRITAFKTEIGSIENQHLTIWGIASQCGFNSKTSFNRIFKKQIGLTPSQYQKSLKK